MKISMCHKVRRKRVITLLKAWILTGSNSTAKFCGID